MASKITSSLEGNDEVWVTYKTTHPTGFHYFGKSSERRIIAGYQGSGPKLKVTFTHPGFECNTWTTTILSRHPTETLAYLAEEKLVPLSLLSDPFCLNTQPGGNKRFYGSVYTKLLKAHSLAKKATKIKLNSDGSATITKGKK